MSHYSLRVGPAGRLGGGCNHPQPIMCARAAWTPSCSGFTIGQIGGIMGNARAHPPPLPRCSRRMLARLFEPILTQTAHFLVPLQRLKSLNHHPQWRVGNFGENYHAETIHFTRCGQKPCALTTRKSRSVRSRRLVAGRCNEQLGKKRAAHRIRVGGHSARCNLGLLRNALVVWPALTIGKLARDR
jgi:hypothetical protein